MAMYNDEGRMVGRVENGWMVKTGLDPNIHQLRTPPAWATDVEHLQVLKDQDCFGLKLLTTDGKEWSATLAQFERYGIHIDRSHGPQIALPLKHWTVRASEQGILL